jgi:hypothetical protein
MWTLGVLCGLGRPPLPIHVFRLLRMLGGQSTDAAHMARRRSSSSSSSSSMLWTWRWSSSSSSSSSTLCSRISHIRGKEVRTFNWTFYAHFPDIVYCYRIYRHPIDLLRHYPLLSISMSIRLGITSSWVYRGCWTMDEPYWAYTPARVMACSTASSERGWGSSHAADSTVQKHHGEAAAAAAAAAASSSKRQRQQQQQQQQQQEQHSLQVDTLRPRNWVITTGWRSRSTRGWKVTDRHSEAFTPMMMVILRQRTECPSMGGAVEAQRKGWCGIWQR